jgi:hypothetical protein
MLVIARLRTTFAIAPRRKLISDDPVNYADNLSEPQPDRLADSGAERLLATASAQERALFTVLILSGLRPNGRWHLNETIPISTAS